ncbi:hypothetical protein [Nocardia salmonicida]|uniref:hypothetical protein n=1 Tax=Nocardia salmonicida TaxID=53431 RepID=UPI0007A3FE4E|nr:hypothetical protein [Nocardia salmonicida]
MKDLLYSALGVVFGAFLVFGGIVTLNSGADCDGKAMSAREICVTTSKGSSVERDAAEQEAQNKRTGWMLIGGGALMGIGSAFWLRSNLRSRRARRAATAPQGFPPVGTPHGLPQGQWQQAAPAPYGSPQPQGQWPQQAPGYNAPAYAPHPQSQPPAPHPGAGYNPNPNYRR